MKKTQLAMFWLLPIIVIGGLIYPVLGYLVLGMMAVLLTLSIFKGRYWCANLCPRGAFLDIAISRLSIKRQIPRFFARQWFRWSVFFMFMCFLTFRIIQTGGNWIAIGAVFVGMCILTTVISVILGVLTKHRSWCAICPMGTLQERLHKISRPNSFCRSKQE
jgi:polyferredoxin